MIPSIVRPISELAVTGLVGVVLGTATVGILGNTAGVIALLGVIATVDMAQFALVLDHRERLVTVEHEVADGDPSKEVARRGD